MGIEVPVATSLRSREQELAARAGFELVERSLPLRDAPVRQARALERRPPAPDGGRPPVLMVHGGGGLATAWIPLMGRLAGRRLVAVDRPGCGLTEGYVYGPDTDLRDHGVRFLDAVIQALDVPRADVVANSMGGLWALWLALDRPDRVRSLTLLGCPALVCGTSAPLAMRVLSRPLLGWMLERPPDRAGLARVFRMMGHDPEALDEALPGLLDAFLLGGRLPGAGASWRSLLERVLTLGGARADCALPDAELDGLQVRPLVIWGTRDPFGSTEVAERFTRAARGRLELLEDAGHLPWLDAPDAAARLVADHLQAIA